MKIDRSIKGSLKVSLRTEDDDVVANFVENVAVNVTLATLLTAAKIDLDTTFASPEIAANTLGSGTLKPRITGVELTLNLDYRNHFMPDETHPVVDVQITGYPATVGHTEVDIIDELGSTRKRTYSGVRVRFIRRGAFEYFQLSSLFMSITVFIVWIRMPGFAVFYFAVFCLGTLSNIYTRFLYQDLNLNNEFNGVSSRLLKRAHGFADLHDLVLGKDGLRAISLATVKKRMQRILEGRKELDEAEREFFTNFFFKHTASDVGKTGELAIQMEDYLKAVTQGENLRYEDILKFVDTDSGTISGKGFLEKLFQDGSLAAFYLSAQIRHDAALAQEEDDREAKENSGEGEDPGRQKSSRKSTSKPNASKFKESSGAMFQLRVLGNTLTSQLDKLEKELATANQAEQQLLQRHNDYLHYLAYLQEKTAERSRQSKMDQV
jgi:hypothetical protein